MITKNKIYIILFINFLLLIFNFINLDSFNEFYIQAIGSSIIIKDSKLWKNISYPTNGLLTNQQVTFYINKFWEEVVNNIDSNKHILILFKVKYEDNSIKSISNLQKLNKEDKDFFINIITDSLSLKMEGYTNTPILSLIFKYSIRNGLAPNKSLGNKTINFQTWYKNKLPIAFNPEDYGKIIGKFHNLYTIQPSNNIVIEIKQLFNNNTKFNLVKYFKNTNLLFEWKDTQTNPNIPNSFIREIGKSTYYYEDGQLVLSQINKQTKPIQRTNIDTSRVNNFITMDLETIIKDNIMEPYLLSWYDGIYKKSYFISDFKNFKDLLSKVFNDLSNYNNYSIYFHNFAKFDSYFILKYLPELGIVDPIIHKDKLITLNFTRIASQENNKPLKLTFKDSYLLLPGSLKNLSKSFNIDSPKGIFPYLLNDIHYIGKVPSIHYFNNITHEEYNSYCEKFLNKEWCFKTEAIKYCELDCKALFQILSKFSSLIFIKFKINIHKCPTTPSLAFKIFRTKFLPKDSIHNISGKTASDIRMSYTGGAIDMYLPTNESNEKIYAYDVNSLYPSMMKNCDMPVGSPTYFEGDIRKIDPSAFGFFYCDIQSPKDLKHPIIQTHVKTNSGIRTMAPLGEWSDMIFSPEMDNAIKYGYKFNIKWGYIFNKGNVFKKYIEVLYKLRLEYHKSDPMNYIAKLLLNSLYGRFGMDDNFMFNDILHKNDVDKFIDMNPDNVKNIIELGDYIIVQSQKTLLEDNESEENNNVNIAVASAITAYARIYMSQFKNNQEYKLFYSDTDSIYINKPLDEKYISNIELGKLKLENILTKGIFLAPKVYGLQTEDGKTIIKAKGLIKEVISKISLSELESLLEKDTIKEFNQEKWYKNISEGNITVKDTIYTLKITENKRELVYNNNILIETKPYEINTIKK